MKIFYHLLLSGLLFCLSSGLSAQNLSVTVTDASGGVGEQVCVDLIGANFTAISGMQFSIAYDDAVLEFVSASGSINGTVVSMIHRPDRPGVIRVSWNLFSTTGFTDAGPFTIGTVCFNVRQAIPTVVDITDTPVPIEFTDDQNVIIDDPTITDGAINGGSNMPTCSDGVMNGNETGVDCGGDCPACPTCDDGVMNGDETGVDCGGSCSPCMTMPTCNDGIMNGDETGVDCGGSCAPCSTGGGPDTDCGNGTSALTFCLGDACDIAMNAPVCIDITAGNFNNITAFETNLTFNTGQLFYQSVTTNPALGDAIQVNVLNASTVKVLYFQQAQSGVTVANGTIVGTLCFTNQTPGVTNLNLENIIANSTTGQVPNPVGNGGAINDCAEPTCDDGIMNGDETGVDCGGSCGTPCMPTCSDGIMNGDETGVDCGGSCTPCSTGGPDTDCGNGTSNFSLCLGDACDIAPGANVCIDITAGNFNNITAFQTDVTFSSGQLTYQSFTTSSALGDPFQVNVQNAGSLRLLYFQQAQSGVTISNGTIIGSLCFTNNTANTTVLNLDALVVTSTNGQVPNPVGNGGSVNGCGGNPPTCSDGIMNGTETGVDCGGSCTPCNTTGGPDTDCGNGTSNFSLCLGDACEVAVGANVCIDITAGNFNNITAFQTDISFNSGQLTYQSFTTSSTLVDPFQVSVVNAGTVRVLYFEQAQSGITVANGTIIGSLCFTNNTANATILNFTSLVANSTSGQLANPVGNGGSVNDCTTMMPTCFDGIMNGDETGVDCGGSCAACPTTDCGEGTTDVEVCIGSECADAGAEVCVPVYVGNFNSLGGLQFALDYNGANLEYTRVIPANALASGTSPGNPSDGRLNIVWNDPNLSGQSFPDDEIAFELCFTVENAVATPITFFNESATLRAFNELGTRLPSSGNPGAANSNCGNEPTCNDGVMNGDETGIDCGGSCTPCNNTGGPDVNCGMGTSSISLCLGDYCDIANGAEVCIDITVGNFTDVNAFQTDIVFPANALTLSSSTSDPRLGDPLLVNQPGNDRVRIIYFQQSQSGVSIDNGEVIGTVCFTNNVAGTTILNLESLTVNTTSGNSPNPVGSGGSINDCGTNTCNNGVQDGDETGIDCGGSCSPCPSAPLGLNVGSGMAAVGEQVCVNVDVEGFTNITNLAFSLNYDPAVLMLSSVTATTALPGFGSGNFDTATSGMIGVSYTSTTPRSLSDDASLFEVCFTVLTGAETDLTITGATATASGGTNLTVNTTTGTINTGGQITYDNLSVVTGDADGAMGTEVCLDYSVYNFSGVAGMQFPITYDATKLQFNSATGSGALTGLQAFSPEAGVVRIIWFDPAIQPNSLDDGTDILSVCFTVLEACETEVSIEDVPRFNIRAINPENNPILPFDVFSGTVNEGVAGDCNPPPGNLVLDLGNAEATIGEEACIDLRVTDFISLDELSFSLVYNADELSFTGVNSFGLASVSAANVSNPSPGVLTFDWDASGSTGQSLADDAVLLSFCFTVDRFTPTDINFGNSPTAIQARNAAGQNIGVVPTGGTINPNVPVTDGLTFQVGSAMAGIGETVCLPVIGYEVNDLVAFQYTLTYPNGVLEYTGTGGGFALSGNVSVVNSAPGILRIVWADANAQGNTVPDGTAIFTICFRVLTGDVGVVSFSDSPTAIEFEDVNSIVTAELLNGQVNGSMAPSIVEVDMDAPACFGGNNGTITLSVSGGPNLTYSWSPNVSTSNIATGLTAGTYNVTVSNQSGQSTSREIVLAEGAQLEFIGEPQVTGVSCNGEADGSIILSVQGGATPYSIDWCGSLPDNVLTQTNLDGGSYCVTVTDANGCMIERPNITVGEPGALLIGGTPINITENPGGVNVVIQGGRMPFTYSWSGPESYSASIEDINDVTVPGTYCLTVTDNNDCEKVQCFAVIEALAYTIDIENGCTGENNGSIDITVRGGNGSYDYEWSNESGPFASTQDLDNLSPGDYTVVITSGMEENTATITIEPEPILAPGTVVPATSGNNGSITLIPSGGNPPFSFLWNDGPTTQNRTDLSSGEYCVTIMDESGCEKEFCYTVGAEAISFGASSTRPSSCSDAEDGVIRLVVDNGTAPFTVRVEPLGTQVMADTNVIEVMVPQGTYDVTVTDAQGGEVVTNLTVDGPSTISAPASLTSDTEDTGCSGMISLDLGGGTGPYTVAWSNNATGPTITQLCSGSYVATVTDDNGCRFTTDTLRISRIDEELDSIGPVACESGADGTISVTISGGVEPYSFNWTRTGSSESLATTEDLSGVTAGDYTLTITDDTGATLVKNYTVGTTSGFSVNVVVTTDYGGFGASCPDANDARLEATISGQGNFFYEWTLGDVMVGTTSSINAQPPGSYTLIVSDDSGCEITQVTEVTAPPAIILNPTVSTISCGSTGDGAISVIASGGVGEYSYSWSTGSSATQIQGLSAGRYDLTVMDGNNCTTTESFTLAAPEDLAITFEATPADDGCNGTIMILPLGGSGNYNFSWPQLPNQGNTPLAEGLCPGEYTIEVTDENECQTVTMVATVLDRRLPCLSTREVITPNGDGLNETLVIFCSGDEVANDNHLEVWNRWGQLVYEVDDYDCSEDGGLECFEGRTNDGELLPPGPYYYVFEFTTAMGPRMQQRGSFTIIRD